MFVSEIKNKLPYFLYLAIFPLLSYFSFDIKAQGHSQKSPNPLTHSMLPSEINNEQLLSKEKELVLRTTTKEADEEKLQETLDKFIKLIEDLPSENIEKVKIISFLLQCFNAPLPPKYLYSLKYQIANLYYDISFYIQNYKGKEREKLINKSLNKFLKDFYTLVQYLPVEKQEFYLSNNVIAIENMEKAFKNQKTSYVAKFLQNGTYQKMMTFSLIAGLMILAYKLILRLINESANKTDAIQKEFFQKVEKITNEAIQNITNLQNKTVQDLHTLINQDVNGIITHSADQLAEIEKTVVCDINNAILQGQQCVAELPAKMIKNNTTTILKTLANRLTQAIHNVQNLKKTYIHSFSEK